MKKPKKVQIHQFDPVIYPFKLWVCITTNFEVLSERFKDGHSGKEINTKFIDEHEAVTYFVQQKEKPTYWGILIATTAKSYFTTKIIAHEATHGSLFAWQFMSESPVGDEADAYLVGWIADCCEKVKLNKEQLLINI